MMIGRTLRATRVELRKLVGSLIFYLTFAAAAIVTSAAGVVACVVARRWRFDYSGLKIMTVASKAGVEISAVFLIAFAGMMVSSECSLRTLNTLLIRPIRRIELFAAKAITIALFVVCTVTLIGVVAAITGHLSMRLSDVVQDGVLLYTRNQALAISAEAYGLLILPLLAACFLALFLSNIIESPGASVAASLGLYFVFLIGRVVPTIGELVDDVAMYSPLGKMNFAINVMTRMSIGSMDIGLSWDSGGDMFYATVVPAAYSVFFLIVSAIIFVRRDVSL